MMYCRSARLMSSAAPGQIIVDGTKLRLLLGGDLPAAPAQPTHGADTLEEWSRLNMEAQWTRTLSALPGCPDVGAIQLTGLGVFQLKGIKQPVPLVQATLLTLSARTLPEMTHKAPARSQLMEERDSVMMGGVTSSKYSGFTITSSLFPTSSKA
jgi:class 3 adenylate cyclase